MAGGVVTRTPLIQAMAETVHRAGFRPDQGDHSQTGGWCISRHYPQAHA